MHNFRERHVKPFFYFLSSWDHKPWTYDASWFHKRGAPWCIWFTDSNLSGKHIIYSKHSQLLINCNCWFWKRAEFLSCTFLTYLFFNSAAIFYELSQNRPIEESYLWLCHFTLLQMFYSRQTTFETKFSPVWGHDLV